MELLYLAAEPCELGTLVAGERTRSSLAGIDVGAVDPLAKGGLGQVEVLPPATIVKVLERCDALRRPERFILMLEAATCDYLGRGGERPETWPAAQRWALLLKHFAGVDAGEIARNCSEKSQIAQHVHAARVAAVSALHKPALPAD